MGNQMLRGRGRMLRRKPESNRRTRICNPLHNHSAIAPALKKGAGWPLLPFCIWSGRRVSNSRPQPWQGCALPTELLPRLHCCNLMFAVSCVFVRGLLFAVHRAPAFTKDSDYTQFLGRVRASGRQGQGGGSPERGWRRRPASASGRPRRIRDSRDALGRGRLGMRPAAQQVVVGGGQANHHAMAGAQLLPGILDGAVQVEQQPALAVVADHALDPEE